MPYIYINKQTNKARIFGSITSLCNATGLKPDNLYTNFNRKGNTEYETDDLRVVKAEIERSKQEE